MSDLTSVVRAVASVTFLLLLTFMFGWAVMPEYRLYIAGLVLGIAAATVNAYYLSIKVRQIVEVVVGQEKRRCSLGFMMRTCIALLVVMLAVKFPQHISLVTTIIGFFVTQLLLIFSIIIWGCMKKV